MLLRLSTKHEVCTLHKIIFDALKYIQSMLIVIHFMVSRLIAEYISFILLPFMLLNCNIPSSMTACQFI